MRTHSLSIAIVAGILVIASPCRADGYRPRVAVYTVDGVGSPLQQHAEDDLHEEAVLADPDLLENTWSVLGNADKPHVDAPDRERREALLDALRRTASWAHLDAVVILTPERRAHGRRQTHVVVIGALSSTPVADAYVPVGPHTQPDSMRRLLGDAIALIASADHPADPGPPPSPTPTPTPTTTPAPSPLSPEADTGVTRAPPQKEGAIIDASYGVELGLRDFHYNDRLTNNLRSYSVVGAPLGIFRADLAPFARSKAPVLTQLGLDVDVATTFSLSSEVNGARVETTWYRFAAGPRYRVPLGAPAALDLSVEYGGERFGFANTPATLTPQLPDVSYRFVRPAIEGRVTIGRVTLKASAAYMNVLSAGELADRVGGASVAGIDAGAGAAYAVFKGFELRAAVGYRRFFYSFQPQHGDPYVAGGALDQYASTELAVALVP